MVIGEIIAIITVPDTPTCSGIEAKYKKKKVLAKYDSA